MKRDMDLVRETLLAIEEGKTWFETGEITDEGFDVAEPELGTRRLLDHHLHIMRQAGLIEFDAATDGGVLVKGLTWDGHEFLDAVRDPEVWKRTKNGAATVGSWSIGLLKDMGAAYFKHVAKERLGLDL